MRKMSCSLLVLVACGAEPDPIVPPPPGSPWGVPISGGTMLVTHNGAHAVIADPDRDRVVWVDLANAEVAGEIALSAGDEPGRVVEDGAGRIHVALRRGGAIVTLDPSTLAVAARRPVCPEPRGLAYSATGDVLHVACTDGQLVTFPAAGGDATRRVQLDRDLRDVVVVGDQLVVTRFRTAELLTLDATGAVVARSLPPLVQREDFDLDTGEVTMVDALASVAWRTIGLPDGRVLMSHQRKLGKTLGTQETGGYGGGCGGGGPVEDAVTLMRPGQPPTALSLSMFGALPVDVAVSPTGDLAFVLASQGGVMTFSAGALEGGTDTSPCQSPTGGTLLVDALGAPTSVAYMPDGRLLVFYPEAPAVAVHRFGWPETDLIGLPGGIGYDPGREMFHISTGVGLACASCHPEGRDDGQVWEFDVLGTRRTQSVAGNVLARAPYHWNGDQVDLHALVTEVFTSRMAGGMTSYAQRTALGKWLDRIPAPAPIAGDPDAVARGKALFEANEVGCLACHNGALHTSNALVNVGTGGTFKVPSLRGVAARPPYLHDGCAPTLLDRLTGACGGGDLHGHTSQLAPAQLDDLVAYLESL